MLLSVFGDNSVIKKAFFQSCNQATLTACQLLLFSNQVKRYDRCSVIQTMGYLNVKPAERTL